MKTKLLRKIRKRFGIFVDTKNMTDEVIEHYITLNFDSINVDKIVIDLKTGKHLAKFYSVDNAINFIKENGIKKFVLFQYWIKKIKKKHFPKKIIKSNYKKIYFTNNGNENNNDYLKK